MTSHELAAKLLEQPDLPVVINGWGSDEGNDFEVTKVIFNEAKQIEHSFAGKTTKLIDFKANIHLDYD